MSRVSRLLVSLMLFGGFCLAGGFTVWAQNTASNKLDTANLIEIRAFSTGDAYYLVKDSIRRGENGQLIYDVIGKNPNLSGGADYPINRSQGSINCRDGVLTAQTQWERLDKNGNITDRYKTLNAPAKALAPNSPLYDILRGACEAEYATSDKPLKWLREPDWQKPLK